MVKTHSADGTARVTEWESRTLPGNQKTLSESLVFFVVVLSSFKQSFDFI